MAKRSLPALTGIRFFLALWVVIYHQIPPVESLLAESPALLHWLSSLLHTGYSAVTAFFVLSGFVLAYNYDLDRPPSSQTVRRFAAARFSRIYPAYLMGLLLLIPLALYRLVNEIYIAPPLQEWGSLLLNFVLLQAWIPSMALSWNYPGWSLSNEAFFYACFPFLGVLLWRLAKPRLLWPLLLLLWGLSCVAPVIAVLAPAHHWGDQPATTSIFPEDISVWVNIVRYNPLIRLPEFCVGILLAKLYAQLSSQHWLQGRGFWLYLPSGLAILLILRQADHIPYPLIHNGALVPLFACMIFGLALNGGLLARWLATPAFLSLGNASYTMYILHAPLYAWLLILFQRVFRLDTHGWTWFTCYLLTVTTFSYFFFILVEEPVHRILRAKLTPRPIIER